MGEYDKETVGKITELQDYSYGDKLTMILSGTDAASETRNSLGQTADESKETNDKLDSDVTPRLRTLVTNTNTTNTKLDTVNASITTGNGKLDTIDGDINTVNGTINTGNTTMADIKADVADIKSTGTTNTPVIAGIRTDTDNIRSILDTMQPVISNIEPMISNINDNVTGYTAGDGLVLDKANKQFSIEPTLYAFLQTVPALEFGTSNSIVVPANSQIAIDIEYAAKTETPVIFTNLQYAATSGKISAYVQSATNQQASIVVVNTGDTDAGDVTVDWLAVSGR